MINDALISRLDAVRQGDKAAFEELYNDLKTPLYTVIFRIIWDKNLSEDILQEVFIKLYFSPPAPSVRNPRAYIFQTARNMAIDCLRKRENHVPLDEIEDIAARTEDFFQKSDIESALKNLREQECQIVTLHIIGELKFREIAEMMKIPLGTVLWKYQKALGKLRNFLSGGVI